MKIEGEWLSRSETQDVLSALASDGHAALVVGGCVRNSILNMPVTDVDIATDATPETVVSLAGWAGLKAVPTGIEHGTVTIVANGIPHEVTTFRRDVETFGRHATVAFSTDVSEDAARRDFTMNALYATALGEVVDPLNGLPDLLARRVRFVGDPEARIAEDYLRILRFFRFHAWYADPEAGIDAEGLAACARYCAEIETLSRERIGAEMRKLLSAPDPSVAVSAMAQAGVLAQVLPGSDPRALRVLVHLEKNDPPRWLRRLAVLGGDDLPERLRLSRAEAGALAALKDGLTSGAGPLELGYRYGFDTGSDIVLAQAAMSGSAPAPDWADSIVTGSTAKFPVSAADLMPALTGPALGARLAELEQLWIASGFRLSRGELLGGSQAV
ncbi:MAG: CCA tRNA nucleotidyltransferase [Cereibacter sphaeroides]|uniref:CCA tRNA nucleotidyltransferase n=1 Tax=Cereibacter sphaeroides TaxID=1063 RepID=A0A2W5U305_CERSP|nr:MAG: CCA tRNA nucleotidyltransferase [Cereibacter sphaeroides]